MFNSIKVWLTVLTVGFAFAFSGCGSSSGSSTGYDVELVTGQMGLQTGKSTFQLKITNRSGSAATGLASSIKLYPIMYMSGYDHSNPVPSDAVTESSTPGTYDCTLYFTMASTDASGMSMGQWELQVTVGDSDTVKVNMDVAMAMGSDTVRATLKNSSDMYTSRSGQSPSMRSYFLFKDAVTAAMNGQYKFKLFLATVQDGMLDFPPLTVGTVLKNASGTTQLTVNSLELQASTDNSTWTTMSCDSTARCDATLSGLTSGVAGKVYVKMKINGVDYTTDGSAASGTNAYASFTVTPGSM